MRSVTFLPSRLLFLAFTLATACAQDPLALFNGTNLDGWDGDPRFWKVEDGCLRAMVVKEGGFQDIRTIRKFREFELEFGFAPGQRAGSARLGHTTSIAIPGVPPGVYYVRVKALNEVGPSPASADVRVVVP